MMKAAAAELMDFELITLILNMLYEKEDISDVKIIQNT